MGGAEDVVLALAETFPGAPIYTSQYDAEKMPAFHHLDVRTTYLQRLPGPLKKLHKLLPMLRGRAFRSLDLSEFDIIISSSSAESKQVRKTRPDQVHICYCHTPIRYYWSHYNEYKKDPGLGWLNLVARLMMPLLVPSLKKADYEAAQKVDVFVANSEEVKKRIKKYYGRNATVVHPPVNTKRFSANRERGDYYVALGRQVPYKRIDLAVAACTKLGATLKVYGDGPEHAKLVAIAGPSIEFYTDRFGDASDRAIEHALSSARGFIFPAEEDFGIVSVQALASGAPIIAFGKGGSLDIVTDDDIGVLFDTQTVDAVAQAVKTMESRRYFPSKLVRTAKRFDVSLFITKMRKLVADNLPTSHR